MSSVQLLDQVSDKTYITVVRDLGGGVGVTLPTLWNMDDRSAIKNSTFGSQSGDHRTIEGCCCNGGMAWGTNCELCPTFGSSK